MDIMNIPKEAYIVILLILVIVSVMSWKPLLGLGLFVALGLFILAGNKKIEDDVKNIPDEEIEKELEEAQEKP